MQPCTKKTSSRQMLERQEEPSPRASRDSMACRHLDSSSSLQNCCLIPLVCGHLLQQPRVTDAGPATIDLFPWRRPVSGLPTGAANSRNFRRHRWPSQVGQVRLAGVRCSLTDTPACQVAPAWVPRPPTPPPMAAHPCTGAPPGTESWCC